MAPSEMAEASASTPTPAASQVANGTAGTLQKDAAQKGEKSKNQKAAAKGADAVPSNGEPKLSGAELKKRQKAEKAERREKEKAERAAALGMPTGASVQAGPSGRTDAGRAQDVASGVVQRGAQPQRTAGTGAQDGSLRQRRASQSASVHPLPLRRRPSPTGAAKEPRKVKKEVGLFGHLYSQPRRQTIEGVSKEVHPAVLALGMQMSNYVICGSNARCVAMLLAFKKAIASYTTPNNTSLARHLTSHYLSPQIEYLKSHRPISVSMGNAIRWLKDFIIHIDPDTPEKAAKADISDGIDTFIRERITVADTAIATTACSKIRNGSTIVTYAKSSIVEKTLLRAHEAGTRFKVIVVDSRPLFEGKNLARSLARAGIAVQYMLLTAASHAVKDADLVLLGAHAMMANGRLYSRVGTAALAMLAHVQDVPVIVCCESIKFTDRVALDSIVLNEIAPPDELLLPVSAGQTVAAVSHVAETGKAVKAAAAAAAEADKALEAEAGLAAWKNVQNLQLLNILFDVTPAEYINMVITEYGSLPPSSVPVVHRLATERDVRV